MARKAVVDASIVAKWFLEEEYTHQALKVRDDFATGALNFIAPSLLLFEVLNALKLSSVFKKKELSQIARALGNYGFELINLTGDFAERTASIAEERNITIYDASYIALAELHKINLYSADWKVVKNCKLAVHIKEVK
ncbi:MAG: type II toxin-antitoxin system VapC family toxin [Candidatus Thermoplasmatota archaeon]